MTTSKRAALSLACTLLAFSVTCAAQKCVFPDYLQSEQNEPWLILYSDPLHLFVDGGTMTAQSQYKHDTELYKRVCAEKLENEKYLVLHKDRTLGSWYLCIQFHVRSVSVVQMSSSNSSVYKRRYMCDDEKLQLNHRPLLSVKHVNSYSMDCPFTGGFDMTVHNPDGSMKCNHRLMPLRLESECEPGEGMSFKFRYADCVESDWEVDYNEQKVSCIASWTHEVESSWTKTKYTFIALRQSAEYQTKLWCMRIASGMRNMFMAHLFIDFVCDPGEEITETDNYAIIDLNQRIFNNPCADENEDCVANYPDICKTEESANCPKTCEICNPDVPVKTCKFAEGVRGKWLLSSAREKRNITVGRTTLVVERYGTFTCQSVPAAEFPDREVLLQQFDNGCHPRYLCVDLSLVPRSNSVIKYRLGNPTSWPLFHKEHLKQYICNNNRFDGGLTTHRRPSVVLVKPRKMQYTRCRLNTFSPGVLGLVNSKFCRGCLFHNKRHRTRMMEVTFLNCSGNGRREIHEYLCISRLNLKLEFPAIITRSKTDKNTFLCWVFPDKDRIFAVLPADCNEDVVRNVKFRDVMPIHDWEVTRNPNYCNLAALPHTTTYAPNVYTMPNRVTSQPKIITKPRSEKKSANINAFNHISQLYAPNRYMCVFSIIFIIYSI